MDTNTSDIGSCPDCGGKQYGTVAIHWAWCAKYSKPLRPDLEVRAELRGKIRNICNELDARYGNAVPGTAERGLYGFHWPADEMVGVQNLCYLLEQARECLRAAPPLPAPGWHLTAARKKSSRAGRAKLSRPDRALPQSESR